MIKLQVEVFWDDAV